MRDSSLSRLPPFHINRPRLTELCGSERIVVVEAAAGYGKSVLAAELIEAWGVLPVWVGLEEGGVTAQLLAGRLRSAVAAAGLSDAAGAMAAAGDDPAGAIDAMLAALAGEEAAIVIDDAHHAARGAATLIDRIADQLRGAERLVVLARRLPPGVPHLRRAEAARLTARELSLRPQETLELCRRGFGLTVSDEQGGLLDEATGGWTAAVALAASLAKRSSRGLEPVTAVTGSHDDALGAALDEVLAALAVEREHVAQLGFLPLLDAEVLSIALDQRTGFEQALDAGLPLTPAGGRWWQLPGPVRDRLASGSSPDPEVLRGAAGHYAAHGELATALQMLLAAGEFEAATRLLSDAELWTIETVDALELLATLDRIPDAVLERFPRALIAVARACGAGWLLEPRARLMRRARAALDAHPDPVLRRMLDAEALVEVLNSGDPARAEEPARAVLREALPDELATRARALTMLASARYLRRAAGGRVSAGALRETAEYLRQAYDIYVALGYRAAAGGIAPQRAIWIALALGRPIEALQILEDGMALTAENPWRLLRNTFFRSQVLTELGRFDEAEANLAEVLRGATALGDQTMLAYVPWQRMVICSLLGDAGRALEHARAVETQRGPSWEAANAHFNADAADCLDRVAHTPLAIEYLERARRDPQSSERVIAMAECAVLARHGDPELARRRLTEIHVNGILPREEWRATLLDAYAAFRLGRAEAGAVAARAFEQAARLEQPQLPLLRERELTEALLSLAVETGLPAARYLEHAALPMAVSVLGRFEVTRGGRAVTLPPGQAEALVKLLAVSGGRLLAEQAIETLWPEIAPDVGRNRLRTLLGRLRDGVGELVRRDGDLLAFESDVRLDLAEFQRAGREAMALAPGDPSAAVALARSAVARYRGPLLPHDPYAEWAEEPREAARSAMLDLLDLCTTVALERGDLDEARRLVQRAIELAPYDDDRWLAVATILRDQGRRGAALSVLRRARAVLAQLGLDPPPRLAELEREVAAEAAGRARLAV